MIERNPNWKNPSSLLCGITVSGPDMISLWPGISYLSDSTVNWVCECEILKNDEKLRRLELERMFGVDFGEPGKRGVDLI